MLRYLLAVTAALLFPMLSSAQCLTTLPPNPAIRTSNSISAGWAPTWNVLVRHRRTVDGTQF